MEYADAINDRAAEKAFAIALGMREDGSAELREIASRAVANSYCVCVTDGEDAAEHHFSRIHAGLIQDLERRLAAHIAQGENR